MSKLTEDSLEFARKQIEKFYDSDFFPKTFEFQAIWHCWDEVKSDLLSKNIGKLSITNPRTLTSKKPKEGFRVVHQLEPIDSLIYTALVYSVAEQIEQARVDINSKVACSYRIKINDGSFFSNNNGFLSFATQSEELANNYQYVLATDITDFYNQIYLHRLNNAIESANQISSEVPNEIERFLSTLNNKASKGIPVGPVASIVLAEAIMIDIDNFLINKGVFHTRYVDDFRIFSNSKEKLNSVLEELTLYLYDNHRLTLSSEKTKVIETKKYINEIMHNHYELERVQLFEKLEVFNPYSGEIEEIKVPVEDENAIANEQFEILAQNVINRQFLDLGLSRALVRKSKTFKIKELSTFIFENFEFFSPIINDVCLYLSSITNTEFINTHKEKLINISNSEIMNRSLVRLWFEWYIANNAELLKIPELSSFILSSPNVTSQAQAAITSKNQAWVRKHKSKLHTFGNWERRAILHSGKVLARDERNNWLKIVEQSSTIPLDRYIAKWVRESS